MTFTKVFRPFTQYCVKASLTAIRAITASSLLGCDATSLARLYFGEFLPFFSACPLKLCQVGWGESLHSYFQVSPGMFDQVQVRALAGPLKDIQRLVPKTLQHDAATTMLHRRDGARIPPDVTHGIQAK